MVGLAALYPPLFLPGLYRCAAGTLEMGIAKPTQAQIPPTQLISIYYLRALQ